MDISNLEFKAPYADAELYSDFGRFGLQAGLRSGSFSGAYLSACFPAVGWLKSKRPSNPLPYIAFTRPLELQRDHLEFKAPYADAELYSDFGRFGLQAGLRSGSFSGADLSEFFPALGWLKSKRPANPLPYIAFTRPLELQRDHLEFKAPYADAELYSDFGRFGLQAGLRSGSFSTEYRSACFPAVGWLKSKRPANPLPCKALSRPLELQRDHLEFKAPYADLALYPDFGRFGLQAGLRSGSFSGADLSACFPAGVLVEVQAARKLAAMHSFIVAA